MILLCCNLRYQHVDVSVIYPQEHSLSCVLFLLQIACGYNAVAGIQECLITMLLYSKVQCEIEISKKGGVLIIKPNCQDVSTVMRNVITAFNELNDAIAGTLKRTDECVANVSYSKTIYYCMYVDHDVNIRNVTRSLPPAHTSHGNVQE